MPDGIGKAVQVGLFTVVKPLGTEMPGWVSFMFFPVTDSLQRTIAENDAESTPPAAVSLRDDFGFYVAWATTGADGCGSATRS